MLETPGEVKAVALYNRALVYAACGEEQEGMEDLEAVFATEEMLVNIKTMARQKLARVDHRAGGGKAWRTR